MGLDFYPGCEEEISKIVEKSQEFDYVRFTYCDTNGIGRCKVVSSRNVRAVLEGGGVGMCCSVSLFDAASNSACIQENEDNGYPDCYVFPGADTFHPCPWSGNSGKHKVAEVICSFHWKPKLEYQGIDSRYQCMKQLAALKEEFGFQLYSALEYEFVLSEKNSNKPLFSGIDICSTFVHKTVEDFHFEVDKRLVAAGVNARTFQVEFGEGQNEITISPKFGVKAGDDAFIFKHCVKETALDFGLHATFMSKPFDVAVTNSGHFNHSLWDDEKNNVMYDAENAIGFSDVARWWIAGILKHAPALCALICPTTNCYRRIVPGSWAPCKVGWAVERRDAFLRGKNEGVKGTYFECRSASGAANPYLVIAGIVAAGMDGLRNKLEPPRQGMNDKSERLPTTLREAVDAFRHDIVLNSMFGTEFTKWYTTLKYETDCTLRDFEQEIATYLKLL